MPAKICSPLDFTCNKWEKHTNYLKNAKMNTCQIQQTTKTLNLCPLIIPALRYLTRRTLCFLNLVGEWAKQARHLHGCTSAKLSWLYKWGAGTGTYVICHWSVALIYMYVIWSTDVQTCLWSLGMDQNDDDTLSWVCSRFYC